MAIKASRSKPTFYAFEAFDPLTGEPPDFVEGKYKEIANRARKILVRRNREEIVAIGDTLCWLLSIEVAGAVVQEMVKALPLAQDDKGGDDYFHFSLNNVSLIIRIMDRINIDDISDAVPDLAWPELLAVLALGEIDEASEWEQHYRRRGFPEDDAIYLTTLGPYAVEAMEAVCTAEMLQRFKAKRSIQAEDTLSDNNKKAALKRHQNTNNLKRDFIHFYRSREFKSGADAARRFYDALPDEKRKLLTPTNAIRTLTDALSDHLKRD